MTCSFLRFGLKIPQPYFYTVHCHALISLIKFQSSSSQGLFFEFHTFWKIYSSLLDRKFARARIINGQGRDFHSSLREYNGKKSRK